MGRNNYQYHFEVSWEPSRRLCDCSRRRNEGPVVWKFGKPLVLKNKQSIWYPVYIYQGERAGECGLHRQISGKAQHRVEATADSLQLVALATGLEHHARCNAWERGVDLQLQWRLDGFTNGALHPAFIHLKQYGSVRGY